MKTLLGISLVLLVLALPAILKERGNPPLVGPDLAELEYSEVFFENTLDELQLAGMLFLPEGEEPHPTVIIIHGSGTSRRNSVWYLSVARHLQQSGIAVLLPDKRGSEKSEGSWLGASLENLANDTLAAVDFVKQQDRFTYSSIGLIGMSQGGWIAPIVASRSDDLAFVVSMSGAVVTTEEQLAHEEIYNIEPYTYMLLARLIAPITARSLMEKEFFVPMAGFDPIPYWLNTQEPVFFAFGGNDTNVPVDASIQRLGEHGLDPHRIEVYPDGGHAIRDPATDAVSEQYLRDLVEFVEETSQ